MNRYAALVVVLGAIASVSFAQSPPDEHRGGRLLDVLRPGMQVKVNTYSDSDPIGIRLEVMSDEGWQEIKRNEAEQRQQIAVLGRRQEELSGQSKEIGQRISKASEQARNSFRARSFRSEANAEELRQRFSEERESTRDLMAKQQELGRQSQEIVSQIRGLQNTLPSAYSTIAHVGADYFSIESEYGVKFYPADRIREIYRRKFRSSDHRAPAEAARPAK